jgi:hypothetical protein
MPASISQYIDAVAFLEIYRLKELLDSNTDE